MSYIGFDPGSNMKIAAVEYEERGEPRVMEVVGIGVGINEISQEPVFSLGNATGMCSDGCMDIEGIPVVGLHMVTTSESDEVAVRLVFSNTYGEVAFISEDITFHKTGGVDSEGRYLCSDVIVNNIIGAKYMNIVVTVAPETSAFIYASPTPEVESDDGNAGAPPLTEPGPHVASISDNVAQSALVYEWPSSGPPYTECRIKGGVIDFTKVIAIRISFAIECKIKSVVLLNGILEKPIPLMGFATITTANPSIDIVYNDVIYEGSSIDPVCLLISFAESEDYDPITVPGIFKLECEYVLK